MIILTDSREQTGWDFEFYGYESEIQKLDTGDYTIKGTNKLICIERKKSTGELAINLGSKKKQFDAEMERMSEFKYKYLLFEFSVNDIVNFPKCSGIPSNLLKNIRINSKYMLKCLEEYQNKYEIEVLYANNRDSAINFALELLQKAQNE